MSSPDDEKVLLPVGEQQNIERRVLLLRNILRCLSVAVENIVGKVPRAIEREREKVQ